VEGVPGPRAYAKFHRYGFKIIGLQPPKSLKNTIFGSFVVRSPVSVKFYVYRSNMSPLRGEKLIFGPMSKHNTGTWMR